MEMSFLDSKFLINIVAASPDPSETPNSYPAYSESFTV